MYVVKSDAKDKFPDCGREVCDYLTRLQGQLTQNSSKGPFMGLDGGIQYRVLPLCCHSCINAVHQCIGLQ